MMGDHGELSVWSLVHRLPVYDSLRVPTRFAVFFTLPPGAARSAGAALDLLMKLLARARAEPVSVDPALAARCCRFLIIAGISVDLFIVHFPTLNRWTEPPITDDFVSDHFYLTTHPYGRWYRQLPAHELRHRAVATKP